MPDSDAEEPHWLDAAAVERINRRILAGTDENFNVMSRHLLESAVARPRFLYNYDNITSIVVLGVRLIEAIGRNHCFEQGNKRTALQAGLLFMRLNGEYFSLPDSVENAKTIEDVILGAIQAEELVKLFENNRL